jgi:hypothetical protein
MGNRPKAREEQPPGTVTALTHRPEVPGLPEVDLKLDRSASADRVPSTLPAPVEGVRAIAFYLPQFHPTPENDRWWGKGFTEWTSVVSARSFFPDHGQPHLPADLGFYDLRLAETRESQAELAREYGIHGFCYYYYWFSGRRLLDVPMAEMLRTGRPDFPFCICWANEPWSRRWDGSEQEVLIEQEHDPKTDEGFIRDVLPILKDPRYIRIGEAPLILVYRVGLLPAPHELFQAWRRIARENGIPALNICIAQTFGSIDPYHYGADSAVEFPPHGLWAGAITEKVADLCAGYTGSIYDYRNVVAEQFARPATDFMKFRCAMPSWDNTPRRGLSGNIFAYSSPEQYELWLRTLVQEAAARRNPDERLVFINAWNEWGEGAFLEPDQRGGRQNLEATRRALVDQSDWRVSIRQLEAIAGDTNGPVREIAASLRQRLLALETANQFLASRLEQQNDTGDIGEFRPGMLFTDRTHEPGAMGYLEQVNRYNFFEETPVVRRDYPLLMKGWCFVPGYRLSADDVFFVTLRTPDDPRVYTCAVGNREERRDVSEYYNLPKEEATWSGFLLTARIAGLDPGSYHVTLNVVLKDRVVQCETDREIFVL